MTFETVARPGVPATQVAIEMPLLDEGTVEIDIPPYAVAGATLAGNVTVTDSSGRQVAAARVDATLDGERVPTTLQGGRLRIEIPSDAPRAPATLRFEVEAPFLALRPLSTQILVQGRSTMSFEEPPVLVIGQRNDITVVVMVDGRPVANETVLVTGAGPATVVPTDADGRAVLSVFSSRVREDAVTVSYLGSDAASASSVALRVDAVGASAATTLPTWAILGAGVLVLGAIVGWQLSRRRRSAVEDVLRRTSRKLRSDHADVRILYDAYLSLLGLLGLEEDTSDHLTFAQLLERAVHQNPAVREHVALLSEVFNEGAYATHVLSRDRATSAADALDAIARSMDAAPS
jgi:hypothetical protein